MNPLLHTRDVADQLRVSESTVRRLPIVFIKMGRSRRYRQEDVDHYVYEQRAFQTEKDFQAIEKKTGKPIKGLSWNEILKNVDFQEGTD